MRQPQATVDVAFLLPYLHRFPNRPLAAFLWRCFLSGCPTFDLSPPYELTLPNNLSTPRYRKLARDHVNSELARGRMIGPFDNPVLPGTRNLPLIGDVKTKDDGTVKERLIFHGSAPRDGSKSARNLWAPACFREMSVEYPSTIVATIMLLGARCVTGFDLEDYFRIFPRPLAEICTNAVILHDDKGRKQWHYALVYGFGESATPATASLFSAFLAWCMRQLIAQHCLGAHHVLCNQDDFHLVHGRGFEHEAPRLTNIIFKFLEQAGVPLQKSKTTVCATSIKYRGYHVFVAQRYAALTPGKITRCVAGPRVMRRGQASRKTWERACGRLEFAAMLITYLSFLVPAIRAHFLKCPASLPQQVLKCPSDSPAHRRLNQTSSVISAAKPLSAPFTNLFASPTAPSARVWSDASGVHGCGAYWDQSYFSWEWPQWAQPHAHYNAREGLSTAWAELAPLCIYLATVGPQISGKTIRWHTDSAPAAQALTLARSPSPAINALLELIFQSLARVSAVVQPIWQSRTHPAQVAADLLSRQDVNAFLKVTSGQTLVSVSAPRGAQDRIRKSIKAGL